MDHDVGPERCRNGDVLQRSDRAPVRRGDLEHLAGEGGFSRRELRDLGPRPEAQGPRPKAQGPRGRVAEAEREFQSSRGVDMRMRLFLLLSLLSLFSLYSLPTFAQSNATDE